MATVTSKGQVTVPKPIRDELGIEPGSQIDFVLEEGRAVLRKRVPKEAFGRWKGVLRGKLPAESVDGMIDLLRGADFFDVFVAKTPRYRSSRR